MSVFRGKRILLGVTGSIAAYKSPFILRGLIKKGAEVRVIMTPSATEFVSPLVLGTLSKSPSVVDFVKTESQTIDWNNHVSLALWADLVLIAPATANTISKMSNGSCDNLLMAVYESSKSQVYIAPAMDLDMYNHPSTKNNLNKLTSYGNIIIPPTIGDLASGLYGEGRMCEPDDIIAFIEKNIFGKLLLRDKSILITAGPTHEHIDPVRFISNSSSGKMGYQLARKSLDMGANVRLVSGPTNQTLNDDSLKHTSVTSAEEMFKQVQLQFYDVDIIIMAAAVADYTPKKVSTQKIKKTTSDTNIELKPTEDILKYLGSHKKDSQFVIGFALETQNAIENAIKKIKTKNIDAIVVNSLEDQGAGFSYNTNKISIIDKTCKLHSFELKSKEKVAEDIINFVCQSIKLI